MPRVTMLETYTCGEGSFRRGKTYDVTDARARMLIGRGSARLQKAEAPPVAETAEATPEAPPPGEASADDPAIEPQADPPAPKSSKAKPAPKPKA